MSSTQTLTRATNLIQWLDQRFDGAEFKREKRSMLAVGCFHAALEYQKAIITLIQAQLPGAAFALTRAVFEAVARGFWLRYCAKETDLDRLSNDEDIGQFEHLLRDLENVEGFGGEMLAIKKRSWKAMNSYTHTGIFQISRRYSEEFVEASYTDEELSEVINFSSVMGSLAAIGICEVTNRENEASSILSKTKELGFWE